LELGRKGADQWAAGALAQIWNWAEKDLFGPTVFYPFFFSFFFSISIPFILKFSKSNFTPI
jgi:hypothetical protein